MSALVFLDIETLGLDIDAPIWEVAAIRREPDGTETTYHAFLRDEWDDPLWVRTELPKVFADDFRERYPNDPTRLSTLLTVERALGDLLYDRPHVVGAVPGFDTARIEHQLGVSGWHHHLIDVEALAVGWLRGRGRPMPDLPWDSDNMSRMVGVDPDRFDRHTAMGDALWTQAIYDRIVYDLAVGGERL